MLRTKTKIPLAMAAVAALAACSGEPTGAPMPFEPILSESPAVPTGQSYVTVCKIAYNAYAGLPDDGTLGSTFDFETSATGGTVLLPTTSLVATTLAAYDPETDCHTVWTNPGVAFDETTEVTVTETATPGFEIAYAYYTYPSKIVTGAQDAILPGDDTRSVTVTPLDGVYIYFKNIAVDVPPPEGGQGCTPGYWRQPHHHDDWVGYAPGDSYLDVFGVGPDIPLSEAVQLRGGGDAALVRTSVAALLNASSEAVGYDLTVAEIIAQVQAAFGTDGAEALKDRLDQLNNQGCPLGGGNDDTVGTTGSGRDTPPSNGRGRGNGRR